MSHRARILGLLSGAGVEPRQPVQPDVTISGIMLDSRQVADGTLFCALQGRHNDGHAFIDQAVTGGARAVLSERTRPRELDPEVAWIQVNDARRATGLLAREWHGRPDEAMTLVGVTGTNGKTTVCYLVESMVRAAGRTAGRMGTVSHAFGGAEHAASRTTPEATEAYEWLARMRNAGVDVVAMEVSSHGLALSRVAGARFAVGAFLNLSRDHLDYHETMERYLEHKSRLIDGLDEQATAVLNADDPRIAGLADRATARAILFGSSKQADVRVLRERCSLDRTAVELDTPVGRVALDSPLIGSFAADNLAAATACALGAGIETAAIATGAGALECVPGRMERLDAGQPFALVVDYAHTDEALARLLDGVRSMTAGRVIVVFGCGGERDRGKRPVMGRAAAQRADLIFLTSDNPRGEDPLAILAEIERGVAEVNGGPQRCRVVPDRGEAIEQAVFEAGPGDTLVVAGKGHETTQTVGRRATSFDDRIAARQALASRGYAGGCHAGA